MREGGGGAAEDEADELSGAVCIAHEGTGEAAAGGFVRAEEFRRQPHEAGAGGGVGAEACASRQDEFVYVLQGHPTLCTDEGKTRLSPGMCAGFRAGTGNGHHLINETAEEVVYLEVGDRTAGDEGSYPDDDLKAVLVEGKWQFTRKDGTPY